MEKSRTARKGRGLAYQVAFVGSLLLASALHAFSFAPFNLAEAAYVFAAPLFVCVLAGLRIRFEGLWLFVSGWLSWIVCLSWLRHCTDHLSGVFSGILGWLAVIGLSAVVAVFWAGALAVAIRILRAASGKSLFGRFGAMLAIAAAWVLFEWVRTWVLGGFPWLTLSVSQWQRPVFLQIVSLTGASGISFVLIFFNAGLAFYGVGIWRNRRKAWWRRLSWEFYAALGLLFLAVGYGLMESGANRRGQMEGPKLALIQPNSAPLEKWDEAAFEANLRLLEDLSTYGKLLGADVILWPEAATALPIVGNAGMRQWVESLSATLKRPLMIGNMAREASPDKGRSSWMNGIFIVDPNRGVMPDYYAKRKLVPFGEYVPLAQVFPFLRSVVPIPGDLAAGERDQVLELIGNGRSYGQVGPLVCYEDIFPQLARRTVKNGADWHFVVTNNAWFGEGAGAIQHAAHSVLRAVETRRPVVRCGNAGWSGVIDEFGQIRHIMRDDRGSIYFQGVEVVQLFRNHWWSNRTSLYVAWGDWFVGLCVFLLGAGLGLVVFSEKEKEVSVQDGRAVRGRRRLFR